VSVAVDRHSKPTKLGYNDIDKILAIFSVNIGHKQAIDDSAKPELLRG